MNPETIITWVGTHRSDILKSALFLAIAYPLVKLAAENFKHRGLTPQRVNEYSYTDYVTAGWGATLMVVVALGWLFWQTASK